MIEKVTVPDKRALVEIFAPDGIGEVVEGTDLVALVAAAVAADEHGPLRDGDVVVVTSKIISKAEGRSRPFEERLDVIDAETVRTVARRESMRIVRTPLGLTIAAAGVDNSNVDSSTILLLPVDPDASARALRVGLEAETGTQLGVVVSDTAGRAWRIGQTDHAIGAAGVRVIERYDGLSDPYGNALHVTAVAIADELAAAADLVKSKLGARPVAVIRGLAHHLSEGHTDTSARDLVRGPSEDLFAVVPARRSSMRCFTRSARRTRTSTSSPPPRVGSPTPWWRRQLRTGIRPSGSAPSWLRRFKALGPEALPRRREAFGFDSSG